MNIDDKQLFEAMGKRLAHAMHEFNHSNHPRQLYWNGYHHASLNCKMTWRS